jgi:hypothetical protein
MMGFEEHQRVYGDDPKLQEDDDERKRPAHVTTSLGLEIPAHVEKARPRQRTASSMPPTHNQGDDVQPGQVHRSRIPESPGNVPEIARLNLAEPPYSPTELYKHKCGTCSMCKLPECLRCFTCKMNSSRTRRYREVCLHKVSSTCCLLVVVVSHNL